MFVYWFTLICKAQVSLCVAVGSNFSFNRYLIVFIIGLITQFRMRHCYIDDALIRFKIIGSEILNFLSFDRVNYLIKSFNEIFLIITIILLFVYIELANYQQATGTNLQRFVRVNRRIPIIRVFIEVHKATWPH